MTTDQDLGPNPVNAIARRDLNAALRERLPRSAAQRKATAKSHAAWTRAIGELQDTARERLDDPGLGSSR